MKSNKNLLKKEWEESYERKENFVFLASDETVRFISRYIVLRTGLNEYKKLYDSKTELKCWMHVVESEGLQFMVFKWD